MYKAVLFDLDGALIDSTEAILDSFAHAFHAVGLTPPSRDAIIATIGEPLPVQLRELTGMDPEPIIAAYRPHYRAHAPARTTLMPGARETLADFRAAGLRMGFATSKNRAAAELLLDALDVLDYFEARVGPGDVGKPKPDPEPVLRALEMLDVAPAEAVFVGDMRFDVLAGKAAGVTTLAVTTGYESRAALEALAPDAVYDGLDAVRAHVLARLARV